MTVAETLAVAVALGVDTREARLLLAQAWGCGEASLVAHPERRPDPAAIACFRDWILRRSRGEPLAYVLGWREFYGLRLCVGPAVLIPRPETELLVERVLDKLPSSGRMLDLGTGSGAVALAVGAARADAVLTAVERSVQALAVALGNAVRLGVKVEFRLGSWFGPVPGRRFDVVAANPPYVAEGDPHLSEGDLRCEPIGALASGVDGLDALREISAGAPKHLKPGAWLLLEHGYNQASAVRTLLAQQGFAEISTWPDLAGIARVTGGRYNPDKFTQV
jgi:release factor glutamine methyltransferase